MLETILGMIGRIILDVILYGTAKIILPIISLGKWRADIVKSKAHWLTGFPWVTRDGKILYFSYEGAIMFGVICWMIFIILGVTFNDI